jgi:beta-aspartyl-peptidase (threonine type)
MGKSGVGVVVGSANARVGMQAAVDVLRAGGSSIDAAIAAVRLVEDNLDDHGVGTGGIPNVLGKVELDASIMDGHSLLSGAVGAIKGYPNPIEIARKVMELTPHAMLVGEGADLFAQHHGFKQAELLTPAAEEEWQRRVVHAGEVGGNQYNDEYQIFMDAVRGWTEMLHSEIYGTTNVIARDGAGNICCAVSTSGWGFKWPGRLGDSPVIAAGNYADNRYGAAACTGRGEMAIRGASAHSVVMYMKFGMSVAEALTEATRDLGWQIDRYAGRHHVMNIVAMDAEGNVNAVSTSDGSGYVVQTTEMDAYEERQRLYVPIEQRAE